MGRKEAFAEESKKQPVWESLVPSPHVTLWTSDLSPCPHWGRGAASTQMYREGYPEMSPSPPFPASWPAWGTVCPRMRSAHWSWRVRGDRKMQQEHLRARVQPGPVSPYCPPIPESSGERGPQTKPVLRASLPSLPHSVRKGAGVQKAQGTERYTCVSPSCSMWQHLPEFVLSPCTDLRLASWRGLLRSSEKRRGDSPPLPPQFPQLPNLGRGPTALSSDLCYSLPHSKR